MALSVISQLAGAALKLNTIAKIYKHKGFHERHHFILMVVKVHGALGCDTDHFIRECYCLFHDRGLEGHLSLSFCIQFFKCVLVLLFSML